MYNILMNLIKRNIILFVVFLTGAAVLVIELTATRILSPYFGNTIFTVSSVITTILAALSFGYYFGGRLADRHPKKSWFYSIILISGLLVFVLQILSKLFLPSVAYKLSFISGPLIISLVLFLVPSFFLGMLSPFAIKLQQVAFKKEGVGTLSGEVFFASTLGSIVGSLATGFVLIPNFGLDSIIIYTASFLVLMGIIGLLTSGIKKNEAKRSHSEVLTKGGIVALAFILFALSLSLGNLNLYPNTVFSKDGVYEKLTVFEGTYENRPTRFFMQDLSSSSAMFLDGDDLVYDYTKYYNLYKLTKAELNNALVLGAGIYSIPKAILADEPNAAVDVVEIEPELQQIAEKYFNLEVSDRLKTYIEDGRRFLEDTNKSYDLIFSDAFASIYSIPSHLTSIQFYELAKQSLTQNGVFVANIIGDLSRQTPNFVLSQMRTFSQVFPNSYFFAVDSPAQIEGQNMIFLGVNSDTPVTLTDELQKHMVNPNRFDLSNYPVLSDNYAPADYLTFGSISRLNVLPNEQIGKESLSLIKQIVSIGPRYPNTKSKDDFIKFLIAEMETLLDQVVLQEFEHEGNTYTNIIARTNLSQKDRIILGTHYDSKKYADKDPKNPQNPVPGANDSASGVAVLIELARNLALSDNDTNLGVDFVFFDGEEGDPDLFGTFEGWYPIGSTEFADKIEKYYPATLPSQAVIIDMVCDKNLNIYAEKSSVLSAPSQVTKFFETAQSLYPKNFSGQVISEIKDDHTPLNEAGIPSFLVIDIDYPHYHTTADTPDKCSAVSLQKVGNVLMEYLKNM